MDEFYSINIELFKTVRHASNHVSLLEPNATSPPSSLLTVKKGYTLIEMMVVLAILTILMAIMLPVYIRALSYAKGGVCHSNLTQIGHALNLYANEHDGQYPPTADFSALRLPDGVTRCKGGGSYDILWTKPQRFSNKILVVDANQLTHNSHFLGVFADGHVEIRSGEGDPTDPEFWR